MARESLAAKRERMQEVLERLDAEYPQAHISLKFRSRWQLLVAVVLSAQCTDAMVNRVTKVLFRRFPTVKAFAEASQEELEAVIRPTGYFRSKARHLRAAAQMVRDEFGARVPSTMPELVRVPGVGRKTANVILWNAFGKSDGVAVDTHVTRLSGLLGFTKHVDPVKIERDLVRLVPASRRGQLTHWFIEHGRAVCVARRPRCEDCALSALCPSNRA